MRNVQRLTMDSFLSRLGAQAMNYAIRSGITLASTYAISQCTRLATTVSDKRLGAELSALQGLLDRKLQVCSSRRRVWIEGELKLIYG